MEDDVSSPQHEAQTGKQVQIQTKIPQSHAMQLSKPFVPRKKKHATPR